MTNGSIMNGNFNRYYGQEVNGNGNLNHSNMKLGSGPPGGPEDGSVDDKFEVPLPFGYHLANIILASVHIVRIGTLERACSVCEILTSQPDISIHTHECRKLYVLFSTGRW